MRIFPFPITIFQGVSSQQSVLLSTDSKIVNPPKDLGISGDVSLTVACTGLVYVITPATRNPALDLIYDCTSTTSSGTTEGGVLNFITTMYGSWINVSVAATALSATVSLQASYIYSVVADGLLELTLALKPNDTYLPITSANKGNWIKWSKIGHLDFTIGRDNTAGERPLDWSGNVYALKKLGEKVAVYGAGGVSLLTPVGKVYGLQTILHFGLKGRNTITGDETKHFFIANNNQLWKLSDRLTLLDYSEYLESLATNTVMSYDAINNLVYICDGAVGFVFNPVTNSLGKGPYNITGIGYKEGVRYIAAPAALTTDPFEICTDIYDFSTRTTKTIFELEFGTDLTNDLYAAIDYRRDKAGDFIQTPWYAVSESGRVAIRAFGREFRIRAKLLTYEYFELDYIKVNGVLNAS